MFAGSLFNEYQYFAYKFQILLLLHTEIKKKVIGTWIHRGLDVCSHQRGHSRFYKN